MTPLSTLERPFGARENIARRLKRRVTVVLTGGSYGFRRRSAQGMLTLGITAASASASASLPCTEDQSVWEIAPTLHGSGGAIISPAVRGVGLMGAGLQVGYSPKSDSCFPPYHNHFPGLWIKLQTENISSFEPSAGFAYTHYPFNREYASSLIMQIEAGGGYSFRSGESSPIILGLLGLGIRVHHPTQGSARYSAGVSDIVIFSEAAALPGDPTRLRLVGGLRIDPVGILRALVRGGS